MSDSTCPMCGYVIDADDAKRIEDQLESMHKSHSDLELKCALANAQVFNLKAALEAIEDAADKADLTVLRDIAREALKGSTCA